MDAIQELRSYQVTAGFNPRARDGRDRISNPDLTTKQLVSIHAPVMDAITKRMRV